MEGTGKPLTHVRMGMVAVAAVHVRDGLGAPAPVRGVVGALSEAEPQGGAIGHAPNLAAGPSASENT
jgi:hypothetical protein